MQIDQEQEESSKNLQADECNANGSMAGSKAQRICMRMNANRSRARRKFKESARG
jgi:hypothetical protein